MASQSGDLRIQADRPQTTIRTPSNFLKVLVDPKDPDVEYVAKVIDLRSQNIILTPHAN